MKQNLKEKEEQYNNDLTF